MARSLAVDRLSVHYAGSGAPAILRLSLDLEEGASVAILGPAGAGKTTLLQAITGLLYAQEHVRLEGAVVVGSAEPHSTSTVTAFPAVSLLPQDPRHLISGFVPSVREELDLTLQQARVPASAWDEHRRNILDRLPIASLLDRAPATLSGGELQLVAVAIAAVARPAVLLLDEPTSALDQSRLNDLTRFILRRGPEASVVVADTTLHSAVLSCERVIVLDHGSPVFSDTREAFWQRLPEFQDLVTLGAWMDLWHRRTRLDPDLFRTVLEATC